VLAVTGRTRPPAEANVTIVAAGVDPGRRPRHNLHDHAMLMQLRSCQLRMIMMMTRQPPFPATPAAAGEAAQPG
jgi:hypothetical protein